MDRKAELIQFYKEFLPSLTAEEIESYVDRMISKEEHLKYGSNVIHFQYYDGLIVDNDILEIERRFESAGLELSRYDMNGVPTASLRDFVLDVFFVMRQPIVEGVLLGLATNGLWDAIKASALLVWKKLKANHWSAPDVQAKKDGLSFGIKVEVDGASTVDFKLEGDASLEVIECSIDKIVSVVSALQAAKIRERRLFCQYNEEAQVWEVFDSMEELLRKHGAEKGSGLGT